ncbi:MAG TPA: epoxide hydrolase [Bacteroidota bacterium]|nr:epoxide hydrolase [Bacteroidota bacterium]
MAIKTFRVNIPERVLGDLRERVQRTRWPDEIEGSGWTYGASLAYMKELAEYWVTSFDWRKTEEEINARPNFMATIDGHDIHFLLIRGSGKKSLPLIAMHGWPGSFLEMMKLIPLLTENDEFTFDLVIPSLPGYGFSGKMTAPGCNIWLMGDLFCALMKELGYEKFGAHGGDFGSGIGMAMALKHPQNVVGLHVNNIEGYYAPLVPQGESLTDEEIRFEKNADQWYEEEGAYSHEQRTRPLTLSYGLNDSPVGLCAWIIEKFHAWSDCGGTIERVLTKDELLAHVTLYWVTETLHSSIRLYHESRRAPLRLTRADAVSVPVGVAQFRLESPFPPRRYVERSFNVQRWTHAGAGGHFPAFEKPVVLADDIRSFFQSLKSGLPAR